MKICDFINELDSLYPKNTSAPWDYDSLQCCADPEKEISRVLVALDVNEEVIDYAVYGGYDLILTHHPMIFGDVGDVVPSKLYGRKLIKLISGGVATASYHTRLDAGENGVNDCLAKLVGLCNIVSFGDDELPSIGRIGEFADPVNTDELCLIIKKKLNTPFVRLSGNRTVKKLAVVGGAGKSLVMAAKAAGADAILTGEVAYNSATDFADSGISVIEAGHYYTEFPVCYRLAELVLQITGIKADVYDKAPQKHF